MTPTIQWLGDVAATGGLVPTLLAKATLLVLLGGLAASALSRAGAAARHLVWGLTVAGLLALPALAVWAPAFELPVLPGGEGLAARAVSGPADSAVATDGLARRAAAAVTPEGVSPASRAVYAADLGKAPGIGVAGLLLALYLAGALGLLGYLGLGLARAVRLGRRARPVDGDVAWRREIAKLRDEQGVRRPVSVRISERVAMPLAYGLRRPVVLLPPEAEAWDAGQRRDVLVHELAHVARADWPVQLAARVACALYWFHPLVWWSVRRLTLEAERACDDRVLVAGSDSCDYAERLLRIAGAGRSVAEPSYAAVAMARRTDLATRIGSILDSRVRRNGLRAYSVLGVAAALLIPLAAVSTARLARAEAPAPAARAAAERPAPAGTEVSPLIAAAGKGDLAEVERRLDAGADPNHVDASRGLSSDVQRSALGEAARSGSLEVARLLLGRGARVDLVPRGDATALITAARHGQPEMVRLLLDAGADPNRVVEGDGTALIAAARAGDRQTVRLLLGAGADPEIWVDGDESAMFHAIDRADTEMVDLLAAAGADPTVARSGDGTPLVEAVREGRRDRVERLIEDGADVDAASPGDGSPLIQAAAAGDLSMVHYLLDAGADPSRAVPGDGDPLIAASRSGHLEAARVLVEAGADPNRVVPGDESPLIQAAGGGHLEVARYLLDAGADPNVRVVVPPSRWRPEGEVRTALSAARRGGHDEMVELLLARGARE